MSLFEQISACVAEARLEEALEDVKAALREKPSDAQARHLYIDLLILAGEYERADGQCGIAATFQPDAVMGFALLRHQLRAMAARDAWFTTGAMPDFPEGPTALDRQAIKVAIAHREGRRDEVHEALAELETLRGEQAMSCNGNEIDDIRDLDDRIPHALEVIMSGGAYLWIDFSRIAALEVEPVARLRDMAFRRAHLTLIDGAVAPVLIPAIYHQPHGEVDQLRLGHATEWLELPTGLTVGRGQRCFLAGNELRALGEIHRLTGVSAEASAVARRSVHG
ncbi:type VI secretion system accessory protein TagJ [Rhizobium straminoryzae]|uniref:Nitrogen fixation protein n=1 Tax=Rhizobium straminoryzae TaxID=1387186 RepID=A0A549TFM3_9HYPH|nr:type VI secretion system accessory protein TagJ [Rhizobium straminoryzae]TRL41325.1 nitrogen fixation protein [Rhizobium straminoryzae]